ncbi:hypothetical protein HK105_208747 [Polyrhizophydium stewartii]|uniref:G protein gamma domain-containing protein n=1 Tax=Polyrhizophydium stewartii TaxID=2732419 RepID=A0ABR4MX09_9FUNG
MHAYLEKLRMSDNLPRIRVSDACKSVVHFAMTTQDPLVIGARNAKKNGISNPFTVTYKVQGFKDQCVIS